MTSSTISFKKVLPLERYGTIWEQATKDHARAKRAEAELATERARLDWLLARNVSLTIWHQGPNSGGASIATYSDRTAIDAAMKEDGK